MAVKVDVEPDRREEGEGQRDAAELDDAIAAQVVDGPMTGARFREYVTGVLVPALRPGDTVVLDNLR